MNAYFFALALAACSGNAQASYAVIDTPQAHYEFSNCFFSDIDVTRLGTVMTIIAYCSTRGRTAQQSNWKPVTHPDGAPLWWDSRLRLDDGYPFQRCEVKDYQRYSDDETVFADCMDDPYAAAKKSP